MAHPLTIHGLLFCGCTRTQKRSNSPVIHNAYHTSLFSLFLSLSTFSVSACLSPCVFVCCCVLVCVVCVVWCVLCGVCECVCVVCVVWCVARLGTQEKPPCVDSKRPRVYRHHAHMCYHMRAWCRYTRGRFECTHGGFLDGHTGKRGRKEGVGGRGPPSVLLTKICQRRVITCFREVHRKKPLVLTNSRFENRSRTTRSRVLQSFALPDEAVHFQQS